MIFEAFQLQVRADIPTGSYLVGSRETCEVAWVDPAEFSDEVLNRIRERELQVRCLLLTHGHYDHTGGVQQAMDRFGCALYAHEQDAPSVSGRVRHIQGGDRIPVGPLMVEVYETPGHTPGSVTYRAGRYLFTGDALFAGSAGGTATLKAFGQQRRSLQEKVFPLGDDLVVCPGHGPMSVVGMERRHNPFFD